MVTNAARPSEAPALRYARWALAATVACMPLYVVRWHLGPVPTTLLETLVLVTIALYVVGRIQSVPTPRPGGGSGWGALTGKAVRGVWIAPRTRLEIPILLLLLAGAIGVVVSFDHVGAAGLYRAYFIEPIVLFFVGFDLLKTEDQVRAVVAALLVGAAVFAILNLGAWAIVLLRHEKIVTSNAPEALYNSPNAVAMFLEPAVAIAAGFVLYASSRRDRVVALACLVFLLASMVLTLSRGGLLTMAVLALIGILTIPQRRLKLALLGAAVIGGIAVSRIPYVAVRLADQYDPTNPNSTFEGRLLIWKDTLSMLRAHPIFGAGLRAYTQTMTHYLNFTRWPQLHPHNIVLAMWSEVGLLGLVAFAAVVTILLWHGWRGFAEATGFYRALLWGTSAAFVAVVVHGMFDTPYFKNDLSVEFWMVAALEAAALALVARGKRPEPDPSAFTVRT